MRCPDCEGNCWKKECLPQFQEDRLRLWSNGRGSNFSYALGQPMPDSRGKLKRLEKEKGIEMLSPSEHPSKHHQAMKDYDDVVKQGASHEEAEKVAQWPTAQTKGKLKNKILDWANKGGMREKIRLGS